MNEGKVRISSGCAIAGIIDRKREMFSGTDIIESIAVMHERSNGLGGGFAAYGIYPGYEDCYALHIFFDDKGARQKTEDFLNCNLKVGMTEAMPLRKVKTVKKPPQIWRYFVRAKEQKLMEAGMSEDEFMVQAVMKINKTIKGAYVFSSGKNMGVFKAVAYPEDAGEFYRLDEYKGYLWTAHGRFPTNTPGWWGGAHPFNLLDWSVVHNGEISSYDANRRFIEMYEYECTLQTDTEVITYIFDFLIRKNNLSIEKAAAVVAPPLWEQIAEKDQKNREKLRRLRGTYGSLLLNGPFSIILSASNGMMALNDRIKLRSLVAAEEGSRLYVASEEAAIRRVAREKLERIWAPRGGEPVIALLEGADDIFLKQDEAN
ncbi:glutamine amidotransferase family protein [Thermosyntropha sp.]|uniref:class II glutamine amidotransferase n=1 Tax=Thermosyntropha sp. TaxID=2740820 RepID=UPI0025D07F79|nr:glutamine amidotransferase family protein [Thermosyntropha sp.]MBO8159109.1 glutamine amidotransferase family protein [Thermosyntropha sp.]